MSQQPTSLITLSDPRSPVRRRIAPCARTLFFRPRSLDPHTAGHDGRAGQRQIFALANLAVSLAQGDKKTILVDTDLRRPTLHTIFNLNNDKGLTSLFIDAKGPIEPAFKDVGVPNLQVLTSGPLPPNPAEVLGSQRMLDVIAALKHGPTSCCSMRRPYRRDGCLGARHARRWRAARHSIRPTRASTPGAPKNSWKNSTSAWSARCSTAPRWTIHWADISEFHFGLRDGVEL